ncbi:MAG: hypothetical protein ABEK29_06170, partial [Bradymonadaceae bacterium]
TDTERGVDAPSARWREADEPPRDGERTFSGPAVEQLTGADEIVAAWSERLRYTKHTQPGYHGGASMQEIVTPLLVLSRDDERATDGFTSFTDAPPNWWRLEQPARRADLDETTDDTDEETRQLELLDESPTTDIQWVRELARTDQFRAAADRRNVDVETAARVIANVHVNDDRMALPSLANVLGRSERRTETLLSVVKKVVNLEGYSALEYRRIDEIVTLDPGLLRRQFRMKE